MVMFVASHTVHETEARTGSMSAALTFAVNNKLTVDDCYRLGPER